MSLFSGLDKFGLGKLEKMDVFEEEKKKEEAAAENTQAAQPAFSEAEVLFDAKQNCPVCGSDFTYKKIRTGKTRVISQDMDLRPKSQPVDSLKYDAIVCPKCGYAALSRFFKYMTDAQAKLIKENISANFSGIKDGEIYTYDDAIERHQLVLANTVVKKAKASEKAYTCLKTAWVCRGKAESLTEDMPDYKSQVEELQSEEMELLSNAYDGFMSAFSAEDFPMCGMDEMTVTYLVAEIARKLGKYDEASRWVSRVLTSREASDRIKDKARDVKELINEQKNA